MGWRLHILAGRVRVFVYHWPSGWIRLLRWLVGIGLPQGRHRGLRWLTGSFLLAIDLLPAALIYSTLMDLVKRSTRPLSAEELELCTVVFGSSLSLHLVTLDPKSGPVRRGFGSAYVSFYTINFWQSLPAHILVHELVHIWQYGRYGSIYISEALWAQHWGGGYDYGGLESLKQYSDGVGLYAFNFEQQADIIEDYFRWRTGMPLQWTINLPGVGAVLEKYRDQLRERTAL